jgi:hypothetical protein
MRRPQRHFGAKQPTRIEHVAAVKTLIAGCTDLDKLDIPTLAKRCGVDRREVECWIGAQRRLRCEVVG